MRSSDSLRMVSITSLVQKNQVGVFQKMRHESIKDELHILEFLLRAREAFRLELSGYSGTFDCQLSSLGKSTCSRFMRS